MNAWDRVPTWAKGLTIIFVLTPLAAGAVMWIVKQSTMTACEQLDARCAEIAASASSDAEDRARCDIVFREFRQNQFVHRGGTEDGYCRAMLSDLDRFSR